MKKILIANRGEIACRIIKSCKKLGLQSIAVYSDIDKNSKHVREADESIHIGGSKAQESYLLPKKIFEVVSNYLDNPNKIDEQISKTQTILKCFKTNALSSTLAANALNKYL